MEKTAMFGRKVWTIQELSRLAGEPRVPYKVIREVTLSHTDFLAFCQDFLADQPWIGENEGGGYKNGVKCIRVIDEATGRKILVNPEGYSYPRYVALEED